MEERSSTPVSSWVMAVSRGSAASTERPRDSCPPAKLMLIVLKIFYVFQSCLPLNLFGKRPLRMRTVAKSTARSGTQSYRSNLWSPLAFLMLCITWTNHSSVPVSRD